MPGAERCLFYVGNGHRLFRMNGRNAQWSSLLRALRDRLYVATFSPPPWEGDKGVGVWLSIGNGQYPFRTDRRCKWNLKEL